MSERFLRQLDILNKEACKTPITVIGAGATGSFTTLALAKMGFSDIVVYDEDIIEEHNFPNQLFPIDTKGQNKAEALKGIVLQYTGEKIVAFPNFYTNQPLEGIVIVALDSMDGRKSVFENWFY